MRRTGGAAITERILIVDDFETVRRSVRGILESEDHWEVCGEAENGEQALRLSKELKPDAIVMDITMPVMSGLEATREITKSSPNAKVLILTMHDPKNFMAPIRHCGAKGALNKSKAASDLTSALAEILAGNTYFQ